MLILMLNLDKRPFVLIYFKKKFKINIKKK
jgi:hypothetical protein